MITSMVSHNGYAEVGGLGFHALVLWPILISIVLVPIGLVAGLVTLVRSCTPPGGWWMMAGHVTAMAAPWIAIGLLVLTGSELTGWEGLFIIPAVILGGAMGAVGLFFFYRKTKAAGPAGVAGAAASSSVDAG